MSTYRAARSHALLGAGTNVSHRSERFLTPNA
jgi:hypothetical protein